MCFKLNFLQMDNTFEAYIKKYLADQYGERSEELYSLSYILQYLVNKTKSANRGAKSRSSFANLYAIYVIVEDYLKQGFDKNGTYAQYEGAQFSVLFKRQRELPFGARLQNHALNSRMNEEFFKFFPTQKGNYPIMRDLKTQRYWFNENYLKIRIGQENINIAQDIINIIDDYVVAKKESFTQFIEKCQQLQTIEDKEPEKIMSFILSLLAPNVDSRLFEIVSYAILKFFYRDQHIYWGYTMEEIRKDYLHLYKTGRTNANDGGIDFVMRPLGRFFQVTETLDFKKYFLDIEKIEKYPISFVIKIDESEEAILDKLKSDAIKTYVVESVVKDYLECIDEIINISKLKHYLKKLKNEGKISDVLKEIRLQSKVEFNYEEDED